MRHLSRAALSLVLVAGCAASPPDNTFAYRPGNGTVASVKAARVQIPAGSLPGSAAAGGRVETPLSRLARPRWVDGYQLELRMDDGTTQAITQDSGSFRAGDRIQVTPEGRVLQTAEPAPTVAAGSTAPAAPALAAPGTVQSVTAGGQVEMRMDDGTTRTLIMPAGAVEPGDRLMIGADGSVSR